MTPMVSSLWAGVVGALTFVGVFVCGIRQVFGLIRSAWGAGNSSRLVHVLSTWTFACLTDGSGCGIKYTNDLLKYVVGLLLCGAKAPPVCRVPLSPE